VAFDCAVDTILSVALVRPKHDVFVESVQYLLAIATTVQVLLCAVVISPDGEISIGKSMYYRVYCVLMELAHYNVSTDNVNMQKVLGTKNGRIFLCGSDGCLYEVDYSLQVTVS
jgi:nuclear pore complex protein Nup155